MDNETNNDQVLFSSNAWQRKWYIAMIKEIQGGTLLLDNNKLSFTGKHKEVYYDLEIRNIASIEFKTGNWFEVKSKTGETYRTTLYNPNDANVSNAWLAVKAVESVNSLTDQWVTILKQYVPVTDNRRDMRKQLLRGYVIGGVVSVVLIVGVFIYYLMRYA